jgi:hypothetical protein
MAEYRLTVDITMSGDIYIEADNEAEARKKFNERFFTSSDLRNFCQINKEVVYAEKEITSKL